VIRCCCSIREAIEVVSPDSYAAGRSRWRGFDAEAEDTTRGVQKPRGWQKDSKLVGIYGMIIEAKVLSIRGP